MVLGLHRAHGQARAGEPAARTDQRLEEGDLLAARSVAEDDLRRGRRERATEIQDVLCQQVADAVGVGVVDPLAHAVGPGVDGVGREGVVEQEEAVLGVVEPGVLAQHVPRQPPQALVETVEHVQALDAYLLDDLLVEVVEQLFARVLLAGGDLVGELALQLVELELDLLGGPALLVDRPMRFSNPRRSPKTGQSWSPENRPVLRGFAGR